MSRWVSLNHALPKASASSSGCSWKRRAIGSYTGSNRSARSVVSIIGGCRLDGSCASGTASSALRSVGRHWCAPAGLFVSSHSKPNRLSKKPLSHLVGAVVQMSSSPLVIASSPIPVPNVFRQPMPCCSIGAPSGSRPTYSVPSAAPCVLPKVCPPAISATVSSSFIARRLNVSRMSCAAATGSGLPLAAVPFVAEPGVLGSPVEILLRLPDVLAPAAEPEGGEAHRLERTVAREDDQVGPREPASVLLLDRPQQAASLVQVPVVRPAVEGGEALCPRARASPTVVDAVGAGAVPRHADEQRPVVTEVGGPPLLGGRHDLDDVGFDRGEVERAERRCVLEPLVHRVDLDRVLRERTQVEHLRPPVLVRRRARRSLRVLEYRAARRSGCLGDLVGHGHPPGP